MPTVPPYVWPTERSNTVAPGSLVRISSLDQKLNGTFRIDIDNTLKLPHDKVISTKGLHTEDLEAAIRTTYQGYFKSQADLRVSIVKKDYLIDVQGLVGKPGQITVTENTSLDEVIVQAGGLRAHGTLDEVRYVRIDGPSGSGIIPLTDYHSGARSVTPHWGGGERLFFQTSAKGEELSPSSSPPVVRVIGQVKNPAEYTATPDSTFFTYLLEAGGPTDRADLAHITLIRAGDTETHARTFNSHDFKDIPPIEAGDTILVNADVPSPMEKSTRVASSIATVLTSLSMLALAAL